MQHIFDSFLREGYRYRVTHAAVARTTGALRLDVSLNFVVPYDGLADARARVRELVPETPEVELRFHYHDMAMSEEEIVHSYLDYLIGQTERRSSALAKAIEGGTARMEENRLIVPVLGSRACTALNEKAADAYAGRLRSAFGIEREVIFENDEETLAQTRSDVEAELRQAPQRAAEASRAGAKKKKTLTGDRLLGRELREEPVPMNTIAPEDEHVVVEGEIFRVESREIKKKRVLVSFLFSDRTTSMCAKCFLGSAQWEALEPVLKPGLSVRVRGKMEFDSYARSDVLMASDIRRVNRRVREDNAPVKRVELHAHTKMSAMDGLNEVEDLVRTAAAWGQPAVAITDHGVVQSFAPAADTAAALAEKGQEIQILYGMEGYVFDDRDCRRADGSIDYKKKNTHHIILIARNKTGLQNLYRLVSISHLQYFYRRPRLPKSVIAAHREGLLIGAACEAGEVFRAITGGASEEELAEIASFYDYLEVQPLVNNSFMIGREGVPSEETLRDFNRRVVALGERLGKPVAATTDAHYGEPEDAIYRNILMAGQGFDDEGGQGLYLRTTEEMLAEFAYLGEEKAREIVVETPRRLAALCEHIEPVPKGKFPPKIENAEEILRDTCEKNAAARYGSPLPAPIRERLDKELDSIIGNGYAVMYVAAKMLVDKSMSDGYLVGSRGSVGSSFAATMAGITEVNPLPPHYICPQCRHLEWGDENEYDCGVDMPPKACPECGAQMEQDGYMIPFETFLGFHGDKEPDIDLNFAGEYQSRAHRYVDEIFGSENVYKAGTIGTIAAKTAYGFVMKYYEEKGRAVNRYEADRLTQKCTGVRRTTGQHPGGIIIVPRGHDITEFCPVQHPANDMTTDIVTTHFDYHSIDKNLLKLDILGHDVPSIIRHLQDMTGVDPLTVPLNDARTMSLFTDIESLEIKDPDYRFRHGTYGIPEFGTPFTRQMLDDTKPDKFADLVRISGFSHGTDVWVNNAQEFIRSGQATMKEAISTRDDIMNYLILKGVPKGEAFQIMEKVRKGKGLTDERAALMQEHGVPEWYIESCRRIQYMFPRAHAVAYVMMSFRIAYYKVYYPAEFYAAYLTTKITDFNWEVIREGGAACLARIDALQARSDLSAKEKNEITVLEVCYEMYARGCSFEPPSLAHSPALRFEVRDGRVVVPLCALAGVGEQVGRAITEAAAERPFETVEDLQLRSKANKTAIQALRDAGALDGMPESDQFSFF